MRGPRAPRSWRPCAGSPPRSSAAGAARGSCDWWWSRSPPARSSPSPPWRAGRRWNPTCAHPSIEEFFEEMGQRLAVRRFYFEAEVGRLAVGASDAELLHFEAAVVLDHLIEDVLHDVGVDQVAFGFDHFLERHRSNIVAGCEHLTRRRGDAEEDAEKHRIFGFEPGVFGRRPTASIHSFRPKSLARPLRSPHHGRRRAGRLCG